MKQKVYQLVFIFLFTLAAEAVALPDPTRPAFFHSGLNGSHSGQHVLSGIIINHLRRLAIVDGHVVREGQKLGDSQVVLIGTNVVQLETPGGRINLFLPMGSVREPVLAPTSMERPESRE